MNKEEVLSILVDNKNYIEKKFDVDKIGLFGSYAKNKQTGESDIDFYVEFKRKTFDNLTGLWIYLETLYTHRTNIFPL